MPTVWAVSCSLAATREVALAFSSYGYLDVSVPHVRSVSLCIQLTVIRESQDQRSFDSSPRHFAAFHALHRLLAPRHPPHALIYLANLINRHDIYTIQFYVPETFVPSPSLGNVYRCHLDFIRLSKISRKTHFPEGLFFASGGMYRALWPMSIPLSKKFYFFLLQHWRRSGSNRQPLPCKGSALPVELRPRITADSPSRLHCIPKADSPPIT